MTIGPGLKAKTSRGLHRYLQWHGLRREAVRRAAHLRSNLRKINNLHIPSLFDTISAMFFDARLAALVSRIEHSKPSHERGYNIPLGFIFI